MWLTSHKSCIIDLQQSKYIQYYNANIHVNNHFSVKSIDRCWSSLDLQTFSLMFFFDIFQSLQSQHLTSLFIISSFCLKHIPSSTKGFEKNFLGSRANCSSMSTAELGEAATATDTTWSNCLGPRMTGGVSNISCKHNLCKMTGR